MIEDHPLVGIGPETFPDEFPGYSRTVLSATAVRHFDRFRVESPHNAVLAVASGAGIPAAIAYLSVLVGVIYVLWHAIRTRSDAAVRLALVAVMAAVLGHVVTERLHEFRDHRKLALLDSCRCERRHCFGRDRRQ